MHYNSKPQISDLQIYCGPLFFDVLTAYSYATVIIKMHIRDDWIVNKVLYDYYN